MKNQFMWFQDLLYRNHDSSIDRDMTNRSMDWIDDPEINPHKYVQPIFNKGTRAIQWSKMITLSTNSARAIGHP